MLRLFVRPLVASSVGLATTLPGCAFVEESDDYEGISVDAAQLSTAEARASTFEELLAGKIRDWKARSVRGVWLRIPTSRADLVPVAVRQEFVPHNCEADQFVLTRWLPGDQANPLPPNASHQVGVGCVVVDATGTKLVLVKEKWGHFKGWKIPTGLVDAREPIDAAAVRECREETGLDVEFDKIIAIRHSHHAPFGKSDLFFLCVLKAKSTDLRLYQRDEIDDAKWGDFDDFLQSTPYPRDTPVWARLYDHCRLAAEEQDGTEGGTDFPADVVVESLPLPPGDGGDNPTTGHRRRRRLGDVPYIHVEHFPSGVPARQTTERPPPMTIFSARPLPPRRKATQ